MAISKAWWLLLFLFNSKSSSGAIGNAKMINLINKSSKFDDRPFMDIKNIDTIVLHQTDMSDKDGIPAIKNRPSTWANVKSNFGVDASGNAYQLNELTRNTGSSNGWNGRSIAIEVDGAYYGIEGDERTFRRNIKYDVNIRDENGNIIRKETRTLIRKPTQISQGTINALRLTIKSIVEEIAKLGGKIKFIVSHRQSSENRVSDPGEAIWRNGAIWARENLGLITPNGVYKGTGYPVPRQWDETASADYFDYMHGKRK